VPLIALGAILALSAFLQFYRLNDLQHFQGDEGLSVLAVRALIMDHRFPVYGLALAVGSAHIGPLFDYLIAIPLWLFHYNPTAAVALNGICQVLAVGLCYDLMTRHGGGRVAGLVAALVLATSQEVVYYSRFLWPNMLPCLVVLILWSLLELRDGRQHHLALLGIWTGVALQLQPTAVLLVPFYVLYLLVFRPPLWSWRYALLGLAAMLLLFAPVIVHELTHGLVETRAWLAYGHHSNGGPGRVLGPTLARVVVLAWRLLGIHQGAWAIALGVALGAGVCARAVLGQGRELSLVPGVPLEPASVPAGAALARLLLLYCAVYLLGFLFFGSGLRPHYMMPLFPVPALALGLLAGHWPPLAPGRAISPWLRALARRLPTARRWLAVAAALGLGAANVQHTWQAGSLLDNFQITLAPERSNRMTLDEMRQVAGAIVSTAANQPFNLLFIAPDDQPFAYRALLLAMGGRLSLHPARLRFLVVQPPDWRRVYWPAWARHLAPCAGSPPMHFTAALVWILHGQSSCSTSHGVMPHNPPGGKTDAGNTSASRAPRGGGNPGPK
jgi:4-amino-4-deoxy-L-arabinose transferase-like glycosyltransferase